jgi:hypothetical protein
MFRKLALAMISVASLAAVTPAHADGMPDEEVVRRPQVEYRWREYRRYDDEPRYRVHRTRHYRDCYRVIRTAIGPRRIDTPCD